jgi:uncharacterized membrane protein
MIHSIHQKGFDSFTTTEYAEGVEWLRTALETAGHHVDYQPSHVAARQFPSTVEELHAYDCVLLSDIGATTLLLHPDTFSRSKTLPNRLAAIRDYVFTGGGLVMIGGYMTFQGIDGKARYHATPVEEALPVIMLEGDDRVEAPEGLATQVKRTDHPILCDVAGAWPLLLGLNNVRPKEGSEVIAVAGGHPLLVAGNFGQGRSVAFTSDCAPHWAPPAFVAWEHYNRLWSQIVAWVAGSGSNQEVTDQTAEPFVL